ncbi:MAG: arginine--tRNA ligase, partial [Chloroflexi bacterium]|nr:arginine--tRNA ligase [Chloroflexota bacterium]
RSADSQMDFDLELAKNESEENPVFYVQYAYARIAGIRQRATERGFDPDLSRGDVSLLGHEAELALVRKMLLLTEIVEMVAVSYEPHHLPHYAQELATAFHSFYKQCDVLPDRDPNLPPELTAARLKLVEAARIVLARTLDLMGMSAPERM